MTVQVENLKPEWKTIDTVSYDVRPGLDLVFSIVIFMVAILLAVLIISGVWHTIWVILTTIVIAGIAIYRFAWAVRHMGKTLGITMLYDGIVKEPPLHNYKLESGKYRKLNLNYPVKYDYVLFYVLYNVAYTIITYEICRDFIARMSSFLILISLACCAVLVYLYYKNQKIFQYLFDLPFLRELFIFVYTPYGIIENLFIEWYRRFIRLEIDHAYLHPNDTVNVFFNIPRKFNPTKFSLQLECDEISGDRAYNIYSERLFEMDNQDDMFGYLNEKEMSFIIPSDAKVSFESNHNSIIWYFSFKLCFKYFKWVEWGFPVNVLPRGVTTETLQAHLN